MAQGSAVILIGNTGSGKSALGNFLVDPSEDHCHPKNKKQTFKSATDNRPMTQVCEAAHVKYARTAVAEDGTEIPDPTIAIIDTPGLNDGINQDLEHKTGIISKLRQVQNVRACLFVVRFDSKIDAQFKATVRYYRRLLPKLFRNNTAIVMTYFPTDEMSVKRREIQGEEYVQKVIRSTKAAVKETAKLQYEPTVFMLDCLPIGKEEIELNLKDREALIDYICQQKPLSRERCQVAKSERMKQDDRKKIVKAEGEIEEETQKLAKANETAQGVLENVQKNNHDIFDVEEELKTLKNRLADKDTDDLETVDNCVVTESWKLIDTLKWTALQKRKKEFDLTSEWPLANAQVRLLNYGGGKLKLEGPTTYTMGPEDTEGKVTYHARGKVTGSYRRGMVATVELQIKCRDKFAKEIGEDKQRKISLEKQLATLQKERAQIDAENVAHEGEISKLRKFIEELKEDIIGWKSDTMSVIEAFKRLQQEVQVLEQACQ